MLYEVIEKKFVTTQTGVFLGTRAGLGAEPQLGWFEKSAQRVVFRRFCCPPPEQLLLGMIGDRAVCCLPSCLCAFVPSLSSPPQQASDRRTPSSDVRSPRTEHKAGTLQQYQRLSADGGCIRLLSREGTKGRQEDMGACISRGSLSSYRNSSFTQKVNRRCLCTFPRTAALQPKAHGRQPFLVW